MLFEKLQNPIVTFSWCNAYDINEADSRDVENPERDPPLYGLAKLKLEIGDVVTIGNQGQMEAFERKRFEYYLVNDVKRDMKTCSKIDELEQLYDNLINLKPRVSFLNSLFHFHEKAQFEYDDFAYWERSDSDLRPLKSYRDHLQNKDDLIRQWLQGYFNRKLQDFFKKTITTPVFQEIYKANRKRLGVAEEVALADKFQAEPVIPKFTYSPMEQDAFDELFDYLVKYKLVSSATSKNHFKAVFGLSKSTKKIVWKASLGLLNSLLKNLPSFFNGKNSDHFIVGAYWFLHNSKVVDHYQLNNNRCKETDPKHTNLVDFLEKLENYYM